LSEIFSRNGFRTDHEPLNYDFIPRLASGTFRSSDRCARYLRERDVLLNLEAESSHFLFEVAPTLAEIFPDARFICTLRDCFSWLESVLNREAASDTRGQYPYWLLWNKRFTRGRTARTLLENGRLGERPCEDTLRSYFRYWAYHYHVVESQVPDDRLLLGRTSELEAELPRISAFLELEKPLRAVEPQNTGSRKLVRLGEMDVDRLTAIADEVCGPTMERHFPEIRHASDAVTTV